MSTRTIEATTAGPTKATRADKPLRRPARTSRAATMLRAVNEPGPAIAASHDPSPSGNLSPVEPALPLDCSISYIIDTMRLLSMDTTFLLNLISRALGECFVAAGRRRLHRVRPGLPTWRSNAQSAGAKGRL